MIVWRAVRALRGKLVAAPDTKVAEIVAVVDALPSRGDADALIAPLRPRLATLRPARPVGFTRLLFTPLDPLVLAAPEWRPGSVVVPRTALAPIAQAVREGVQEEANRVDAHARLGSISESRLAELSAALWPRAAAVVDAMPLPPGWVEATGLPEKEYQPIAVVVAAVLGVAGELQALASRREAPSEDTIRAVLGRTAPRGPAALSAVVAVLLARVACGGRVVALATEAAGCNPPRPVDEAIDYTLDRLETTLAAGTALSASMAQATQDAGRITGMLQEIEPSAASRPVRKQRIERLRREADALCKARFEKALQDEFIAKLAMLPPDPDEGSVVAIEATARGLRRFEAHGRRLGSGDRYDALLRGVIRPLQEQAGALRVEDRVRLTEILAGADEALHLLEQLSGTQVSVYAATT